MPLHRASCRPRESTVRRTWWCRRNFGDQALRELALEHGQFLLHLVRHVERIGARRLVDRQSRRRLAVEREGLAVGLRSELDPAHVTEPRDLAGAAGLDDHLRELGRVAEPAGDVEGFGTFGRAAPGARRFWPAVTCVLCCRNASITSWGMSPRACI